MRTMELTPITFLFLLEVDSKFEVELFLIKLKIIISSKTIAKFPALECQLTMTQQPLSVQPTVALASPG